MRRLWVAVIPALLAGCVFKERVETESVQFTEAFERITIDSDAGNVTIRGGGSTLATGNATYRYDRARPEMVWSLQADGELFVSVNCAYEEFLCEVELDIEIPDTTVTLVDTRVGDIEASGILLTTTLDARGGSVTATDIGGDLTVEVGVGDVVATGLTGRRVVVDAEEGAIELEHSLSFDSIRADTGAGDVGITVKDGRYNVVAVASGSVSVTGLTADASVETRIEASTGDGDVVITGTP